jgi:hypothetical protein
MAPHVIRAGGERAAPFGVPSGARSSGWARAKPARSRWSCGSRRPYGPRRVAGSSGACRRPTQPRSADKRFERPDVVRVGDRARVHVRTSGPDAHEGRSERPARAVSRDAYRGPPGDAQPPGDLCACLPAAASGRLCPADAHALHCDEGPDRHLVVMRHSSPVIIHTRKWDAIHSRSRGGEVSTSTPNSVNDHPRPGNDQPELMNPSDVVLRGGVPRHDVQVRALFGKPAAGACDGPSRPVAARS